MKFLDNIYIRLVVNCLFVVFQPKFWFQLGSTSLKLDKALWEAMNKENFTLVTDCCGDCYTARFEGSCKDVWISNYPYAFGRIFNQNVPLQKVDEYFLPLSITRARLNKLVLGKVKATNKTESEEFYKSLQRNTNGNNYTY